MSILIMTSIKIVLVEPEISENVGFVARIMKNFGLKELILVNPKCDIDRSYKTAMHGRDILENAKIVDKIPKFDFTIATSSKLGRRRNLRRVYIQSSEISQYITKDTGILFGRESIGLKNEEIEMADVLVHIPTSNYKALNLSHAVGIIAYELFKSKKFNENLASKKEREVLIKFLNSCCEKVDCKENTKYAIKNMVNRAKLKEKEASLLIGFFRKVYEKLI